MKLFSSSSSQKGFTLIELTIVLVITGLMISGFTRLLSVYVIQRQEAAMQTTSRSVRTALSEFVDERQRLPCPAPLNAQRDGPTFGVPQETDLTTDTPCDISSGGVFFIEGVVGDVTDDVYIGAVPTQALNIASQYAVDPHKNRLTYAVSAQLAKTDGLIDRTAPGAITIKQTATSNLTGVQFALISHGPDGAGSYTSDGVQNGTACIGSTAHADDENCNNSDNIFADFQQARNESSLEYFDDSIAFQFFDNTTSGWWEETSVGSNDIVNRNTGNLLIKAGSNLGIGTDTPTATFHVAGDAAFDELIKVGVAADTDCDVDHVGAIRYVSITDGMEYCAADDGGGNPGWVVFMTGTAGTGGLPTGCAEGESVIFDATGNPVCATGSGVIGKFSLRVQHRVVGAHNGLQIIITCGSAATGTAYCSGSSQTFPRPTLRYGCNSGILVFTGQQPNTSLTTGGHGIVLKQGTHNYICLGD